MKLIDLLKTIDVNTLIWISESPDQDGIFCGPQGDLTMGTLHKYYDRNVAFIYPESYGAYFNRHGISIIID